MCHRWGRETLVLAVRARSSLRSLPWSVHLDAHLPRHARHARRRELVAGRHSQAPNFANDGELQLAYDFVPRARRNAWSNLFVDWSSPLTPNERQELLSYVRKSNYFSAEGEILLAQQLRTPPKE